MLEFDVAGIVRDHEGEPVDVRKGPFVAHDLRGDLRLHALERGYTDTAWHAQQQARGEVAERAAGSFPKRMVWMTERGIAEIIAVEDARIELGNVFRRVLQIVVHDDNHSTAGVPQSGHDGIVLAAIAPEIDALDLARVTAGLLDHLP